MHWEILSYVGVITFAISGAIIAMEEGYDLFGVLFLGLITAFGGGIIRNLMIGIPVSNLWTQGPLLHIAAIAVIVVFLLPVRWILRWKYLEPILDAVGLAAFSIQGALLAVAMDFPKTAIIFAAMATGVGGGVIRDVLAGRKPVVFRDEVYAAWACLSGLICSFHLVQTTFQSLLLLAVIVALRLISYYFSWKIPRRQLSRDRYRSGANTPL